MAERKWYIQPPTILPPTLLGFRGFEPRPIPPLSDVANDIAAKAMYAKDMWSAPQLMAEIAQGANPATLAVVNAMFFLYSITPDVLKPPFTYYSGGFERASPATYVYFSFEALLQLQLNQLSALKERLNLSAEFLKAVQPPESKALYEALDKTSGAIEQALKSAAEAEESDWAKFPLSFGEFYKKMSDAMKAVDELGNSMFREERSAEPQPRIEPPHPEGPNDLKYDYQDVNRAGGDGGGLPSPNEDSEFDG